MVFEAIAAIGLGLSAYQMYMNSRNAAAAGRLSAQQQALNEKQARSNIRLQSAENAANLDILKMMTEPVDGGPSMQAQSQALQVAQFEMQGLGQFNAMGEQIQNAKMQFTQAQEATRQARDAVGEANVMAAAHGLVGGTGTSAGAMGERVEGDLANRVTEQGYIQGRIGSREAEMKMMFGEGMTLDTNEGIYGQSFTELKNQQLLDNTQLQADKDILELTQEELKQQYKDVGGEWNEKDDRNIVEKLRDKILGNEYEEGPESEEHREKRLKKEAKFKEDAKKKKQKALADSLDYMGEGA